MTDELNIRVGVKSTAGPAFAKLGQQVSKTRTALKLTKPTMAGVAAAARNMGRAVKLAGTGFMGLGRMAGRLGGILRGALMGGMILAAGAVMGLRSAFSGMYDAMEGSDGVAGGMADVGEQAESTATGLDNAATASEKAAEKAKVAFGAWGQVGEGFVMAQGKIAEEVASTAASAASAATDSAEAMDDARDSIGGATQATSRFGKAVNRISAAFARAKTIILQAIAEAITPALEAFADLLESPTFQKFVDLLAKDLAKAAESVAKWLIDDVIPALEDLMEKVNAAGGPIEYLKIKWGELRATALMIFAIIVGKVLMASNWLRDKFKQAIDGIKLYFTTLGDAAQLIFNKIREGAETAMQGAIDTIKAAFNFLINALEKAINAAIQLLRPFISMYNAVAEAAGGSEIEGMGSVSLPRLAQGAIVNSPMAAVVGDASSPEVVSPLDDLVGILKNLGVGGATINVTVPPGTSNPQAFGDSVGNAIVTAMRRSGQRLPTI